MLLLVGIVFVGIDCCSDVVFDGDVLFLFVSVVWMLKFVIGVVVMVIVNGYSYLFCMVGILFGVVEG